MQSAAQQRCPRGARPCFGKVRPSLARLAPNSSRSTSIAVKAEPAHSNGNGTAIGDIEDLRHVTRDGLGLELLLARGGPEAEKRPPLLFVHGSYHGAWCWKYHFLPYFASSGFNAYAISLRGQGNSDPLADTLVAGTLDTHARDLADLIEMFPSPPIVIGHSFGGLILQKYLLGVKSESFRALSGAGFLCSVPPSGNKNMVGRFLLKDLILSIKVTYGFISKSFTTDLTACRELFFSQDLPEEDVRKYQDELSKCSNVRLMDLKDVNAQVPLPSPPLDHPPVFVLGTEDDVVVDVEAVRETALYFKTQPLVLRGVAHDCMLDTRWQVVARELEGWLAKLSVKGFSTV